MLSQEVSFASSVSHVVSSPVVSVNIPFSASSARHSSNSRCTHILFVWRDRIFHLGRVAWKSPSEVRADFPCGWAILLFIWWEFVLIRSMFVHKSVWLSNNNCWRRDISAEPIIIDAAVVITIITIIVHTFPPATWGVAAPSSRLFGPIFRRRFLFVYVRVIANVCMKIVCGRTGTTYFPATWPSASAGRVLMLSQCWLTGNSARRWFCECRSFHDSPLIGAAFVFSRVNTQLSVHLFVQTQVDPISLQTLHTRRVFWFGPIPSLPTVHVPHNTPHGVFFLIKCQVQQRESVSTYSANRK